MNTMTGVITQVIERRNAGGSVWLVEVEALANGDYHHVDIPVYTERDAKAVRRGDEVIITEIPDDLEELLNEIPFED